MSLDEGGEPPCYQHLLEGDHEVVRLRAIAESAARDATGALWSMRPDGDLNANLVRLGPSGVIDAHRNDERDVLVVVLSGAGVITIDDSVLGVETEDLVHIPRESERSIRAGERGLVYLTVHQNRGPLTIRPSSGRPHSS
jgi:quercetin dioxygenase-like cupin family protein